MMSVLKDVLKVLDDGPILKVIDDQGISGPSMNDLLSLSEQDISSLSYTDGSNTQPLSLQKRSLVLRILKAWNFYLMAQYGLKRVEWDNASMINEDDFDDFRIGIYDPDQPIRKISPIPNLSAQTGSTPGMTTSSPSTTSVSSYEFRRGIKRDKTHYTEMRDERNWDEWKRKTTATAHAHGCVNILNPSYVPSSPDETALFREQQNFMYDVFLTVVRTHMGKFYVRNHEEAPRDAQAAWKDYSTYMKISTRADIQIEDLMTSLTSFRLDTSQYNGLTQSFVTKWLDQLRQYEDLTPWTAHFPDPMKKAMLQRNALNGVRAFKDVKTSEPLEVAKGRGAIGYNEYVSLIQKVAANFDNDFRPPRRTRHPQIPRLQGKNAHETDVDDIHQTIHESEDLEEYDYVYAQVDGIDDEHFVASWDPAQLPALSLHQNSSTHMRFSHSNHTILHSIPKGRSQTRKSLLPKSFYFTPSWPSSTTAGASTQSQ